MSLSSLPPEILSSLFLDIDSICLLALTGDKSMIRNLSRTQNLSLNGYLRPALIGIGISCLDLRNDRALSSLEGIPISIKRLYIRTKLANFSPLKRMTQLVYLDVRKTGFSANDCQHLPETLTSLRADSIKSVHPSLSQLPLISVNLPNCKSGLELLPLSVVHLVVQISAVNPHDILLRFSNLQSISLVDDSARVLNRQDPPPPIPMIYLKILFPPSVTWATGFFKPPALSSEFLALATQSRLLTLENAVVSCPNLQKLFYTPRKSDSFDFSKFTNLKLLGLQFMTKKSFPPTLFPPTLTDLRLHRCGVGTLKSSSLPLLRSLVIGNSPRLQMMMDGDLVHLKELVIHNRLQIVSPGLGALNPIYWRFPSLNSISIYESSTPIDLTLFPRIRSFTQHKGEPCHRLSPSLRNIRFPAETPTEEILEAIKMVPGLLELKNTIVFSSFGEMEEGLRLLPPRLQYIRVYLEIPGPGNKLFFAIETQESPEYQSLIRWRRSRSRYLMGLSLNVTSGGCRGNHPDSPCMQDCKLFSFNTRF